MTWHIVYSNRARRDLRTLDHAVARRVVEALDRLATTGYGDVKRVQGQALRWRLRVGDWRVVFSYEPRGHTLRVLNIRHRSKAYR